MTEDTFSYAWFALIERNIHRRAGDGANGTQESFIDEHGIQQNDGRSKTQTGFNSARPMDAYGTPVSNPLINRNGKPIRKWEHLNQLNDGVQENDRASANWQAGKVNDAELFCEHLNFNAAQTDRVVGMAKTLDFDRFGSYNTDQVLVACCSMVADEDTTDFSERIIITDEFKELMEATNLGSREHRKIRQGLRERTEFFE